MRKKNYTIALSLAVYSCLIGGFIYYTTCFQKEPIDTTTIPNPLLQQDNSIQLIRDAPLNAQKEPTGEELNKQKDEVTTGDRIAPREKLPNFVDAAKVVTSAVVHIKSTCNPKTEQQNTIHHPLEHLFKEFFGEGFQVNPREYKREPRSSMGSGVIYTSDGYIITNCHVIDGADEIEVTLDNNRKYIAKLVGKDAEVDLALLKIEEKNLSYLKIGSSDELQVGDWVLAVGNPFSLNSTVTKGIVSAKARNQLGMYRSGEKKLSIQSFIQVDAAVNPGNSGGALTNLKGELVGINTAIVGSQTGTFTGYAFAIPSSLVKKVTDDLMQHGVVQRAMLGVMILDVNADLAKNKGLKRFQGVYIAEVTKGGASDQADLKAGDIIIAVNGKETKKGSELQELIGCCRPDEKVYVTFDRKGKVQTIPLILKQIVPPTQLVVQKDQILLEGATFQNLDKITKEKLKLNRGGVIIQSLEEGKFKKGGLKQGFIITTIDKQPVQNIMTLHKLFKTKKGVVLIEGLYKDGTLGYAAIELVGR